MITEILKQLAVNLSFPNFTLKVLLNANKSTDDWRFFMSSKEILKVNFYFIGSFSDVFRELPNI